MRESRMGKRVRLLVRLPAVPLNSESQLLSGKGNKKEKHKKQGLFHPTASCRTFATCNDAFRFGGNRLELCPSPARMQAGRQSSKQASRARNWREPAS